MSFPRLVLIILLIALGGMASRRWGHPPVVARVPAVAKS